MEAPAFTGTDRPKRLNNSTFETWAESGTAGSPLEPIDLIGSFLGLDSSPSQFLTPYLPKGD
ncbi:unnamed protein product, partial [Nesidiocoris tenuis]